MNNINNFHTNGYDILSNEVPRETIDYLKSYTLELKNRMISNPKFETIPNLMVQVSMVDSMIWHHRHHWPMIVKTKII